MMGILLRRLWHQRALSLVLWMGITTVIALAAAIPLYADAVHYRVLHAHLQAEDHHPPFAFLFRYVGDWYGPVAWAPYEQVDRFLTQEAPARIALPLRLQVRFARSPRLQVFLPDVDTQETQPLFWTHIAFMSALAEHVDIVDGAYPPDAAAGPLPVLISEGLADSVGLSVGDVLLLVGKEGEPFRARVTGIWVPRDERDPYWFYPLEAFQETLFIPEPLFREQVVPRWKKPVNQAVWYTVFDGRAVRSEDVPGLVRRIRRVEAQAAALLPHLALEVSPVDALEQYRHAATTLALQMTLFSLPIFGLLLAFLGLVAAMLGLRRQGEIAILRSRGARREHVVALQVGEGIILGIVALPLGLLLAGDLARRLALVHVFLDPAFALAPTSLPVRYSRTAVLFAAAGLFTALVALALPTWSAARHTVISHKQALARPPRAAFWQRVYADALLLLPTLYGYWLLRNHPAAGQEVNFFANPLLFLVPTLFVVSGALLVVRLFPWGVKGMAALFERLPGIAALLAFRHLARAPGLVTTPLTLLILTVGLATFIASTAVTVDRNVYDQVYYRVGADMRLTELGERVPQEEGAPGEAAETWVFLPVSEHLRVPGVRAATRVGIYPAEVSLAGGVERGQVVGVDRVTFPQVAFFRPDFARGQSLAALMNALAQDPMALLVQHSFLARHGLQVGDPLALTVGAGDLQARGVFIIVGTFDLFPGVSLEKGPIFVTHLDTLFELWGGEVPYEVWLRLAPGARGEDVVAGVRNLGIPVVVAEDARAQVREARQRAAREGVFGILSAGFLAAAFLTLLSFVLVAVLSFRRRYVELGVLRALGFSQGQMAWLLAVEQVTMFLVGLTAGVGLGLAASYLFIPFLRPEIPVPPFIVHIAWREIGGMVGLFGVALALSLAVVWTLLRHLRLFEAVKMGEMV